MSISRQASRMTDVTRSKDEAGLRAGVKHDVGLVRDESIVGRYEILWVCAGVQSRHENKNVVWASLWAKNCKDSIGV